MVSLAASNNSLNYCDDKSNYFQYRRKMLQIVTL